MNEPWLGHWDGCSIQHSDYCDCDPDNEIYLGEEANDGQAEELGDSRDAEA